MKIKRFSVAHTKKKFITSENIGKLSCTGFHWLFLFLLQTLVFLIQSEGHMHFHFITHGTNERALWYVVMMTTMSPKRRSREFFVWCRRGWVGIFIYETKDSLHFVPHSFRTLTSTGVLVYWLELTFLHHFPYGNVLVLNIWMNHHINLFAHFMSLFFMHSRLHCVWYVVFILTRVVDHQLVSLSVGCWFILCMKIVCEFLPFEWTNFSLRKFIFASRHGISEKQKF